MLAGMGLLTVQREAIAGLWPELTPLAAEHWREVRWEGGTEADLARERYEAADAAGSYRIFTARQDGRLVGYAAYWIAHHTQQRTSLEADCDGVYLTPDARQGGAGIELIRQSGLALRDMGVRAIYQHVRGARDYSPVLKRLGYDPIEIVYVKTLT